MDKADMIALIAAPIYAVMCGSSSRKQSEIDRMMQQALTEAVRLWEMSVLRNPT